MTALPLTRKKFTPEEYLMIERVADSRNEYLDGEIYEMAHTDWTHGTIVDNLICIVHGRLKGTPFLGMSRTMKVAAGTAVLYPDYLVAGEDRRYYDAEHDLLLNPIAIFEIQSPTMEQYDRTTKFDLYKQINTLREYILIASDSMRVDHWARMDDGAWRQSVLVGEGDALILESAPAAIPLAELYDDVAISPQQA